jgi:hypothetical protein
MLNRDRGRASDPSRHLEPRRWFNLGHTRSALQQHHRIERQAVPPVGVEGVARRRLLAGPYAAVGDIPGNSFAGPGGFLEQRGAPKLVGRSAAAQDVDVADRPWDISEHLTGVRFPLGAPTGARL